MSDLALNSSGSSYIIIIVLHIAMHTDPWIRNLSVQSIYLGLAWLCEIILDRELDLASFVF